MVMPTKQRCPECGKEFIGSDAIGDICSECKNPSGITDQVIKAFNNKPKDYHQLCEGAGLEPLEWKKDANQLDVKIGCVKVNIGTYGSLIGDRYSMYAENSGVVLAQRQFQDLDQAKFVATCLVRFP